MVRTTRPSADATRKRILSAAKKCFLAYGFAGTAMQKIADTAQVNQNLLFHHFGNKANLWQKVKEDVASIHKQNFQPNMNSAREFITDVINYRFNLYCHSADLVQLMRWQYCEHISSLDWSDVGFAIPFAWQKPIVHFQQQGQLNSNISVQEITLLMASTVYPLLQNSIKLTKTELDHYRQLAIDSCLAALLSPCVNNDLQP